MTESFLSLFQDSLRGGCLFFVLGSIFGSFANVLIFRLPRNMDFVRIRSFCDHCRIQLKWFENIPLLSWLFLRGKCRSCKKNISFRCFMVELIMGGLFLSLFLHLGWTWFLLESLVFVFGLMVVSVIDLDFFLIPDSFSLSGMALGLVGAFLNPEREFLEALIGGFLGGAILWSVAFLYYAWRKREGIGGGDIKLLAWIGTLFNSKAIFFVIIVSGFIGFFSGMLLFTFSRTKEEFRSFSIPFGPYLSLSAVLYLFYGPHLVDWYLGFWGAP